MCLYERLVQLLALEVQVTGRSYHAQDHEGVPHESIRSASIEEVRELDEAQEVEGLGVGLEIEEVPDRRERSQAMDGTSSLGTSSKGPSSYQMCWVSSGAARTPWSVNDWRASPCWRSQFS